jgi:aminoglycoside phosphotransferase (APT) family kinase protein
VIGDQDRGKADQEALRPPRLHADEVFVDDALVRRLIDEQFPAWRHLRLRRVRSTGTDNAIFRLGHDMGIRLPRIHWAVPQIRKEYEWLGRISPQLPVSVPAPIAVGEPGPGYPYPWLIFRWLEGRDLLGSFVDDMRRLASDVANFVLALQSVDPSGAPPALSRGGSLQLEDEAARRAIHRLERGTARRALRV